ncbi:MAG: hypothetical protein NTZ67_03650 [Gammaproteobacteria bacterium]|nr:hypothetical protein [Gammaproteobacteria bacterium]
MRRILIFIFLFFSCSTPLFAAGIKPFQQFQEGLRYWGSDPACEKVLKNVSFHENFTSDFVPGAGGMIYLLLQNPSPDRPPITTYLFKDGDEDRYGFTNYYSPGTFSLRVDHQSLYLRGVILNICIDPENPVITLRKQSGVMIELPSGAICMMTTHVWNFCR